MPNEPTKEQLESRKRLADFVEAAGERLRGLTSGLKSAWFGRPDDELKGWIERGRAIAEIEGSMGYRLIMDTLAAELAHAQAALENCPESDIRDWRACLKALRFIRGFIITTQRDADIANTVLEGRAGAIARESHAFVRNARVEN